MHRLLSWAERMASEDVLGSSIRNSHLLAFEVARLGLSLLEAYGAHQSKTMKKTSSPVSFVRFALPFPSRECGSTPG